MKTPYNNNADAVMECVYGVLTAIAHLAGCTPAPIGESLKYHPKHGHREESPPAYER
jgi:hypothetical protein